MTSPAAQYAAAVAKQKKPARYRNTPVVVDGVRHASKAEANRWAELQILERAGEITHLTHQPVFHLRINGIVVCDYVGDASYRIKGALTVEDTKSPITRKNPVYVLKRKMMRAAYGIDILEVM